MAHSDTLFDLTGKTAVVTGTASGRGVICARILAERGAHQGPASPCRVAGHSSGAVGSSSTEAVSHVDTLLPIADYSGTDTAVSAGSLLAGSGDVAPRQPPPGVGMVRTATRQRATMLRTVQGVHRAVDGGPPASTGPSVASRLSPPGPLSRSGIGRRTADPAYGQRTPTTQGHGPRRRGPGDWRS
jgi:hypothetical protein